MRKRHDYMLLFAVLALLSIGLVMIASASPSGAVEMGDSYFYIKRHLAAMVVGFILLYLGSRIDYHEWKRFAFPGLAVSVGLLLLVFLPKIGIHASGAARWIDLGPLSFQPSELAKFSIILFLAASIVNKKEKIRDFKEGLLPLVMPVGLICLLILMEPDMGTAMIIGMVSFLMLFIGGASIWQLLLLGIMAGLAAVAYSWYSPYRRQRLLAFIDPWVDQQNIGYQITQSLLAVGSGGFLGLGLGASRQKFQYLPQQYIDFIFAVLCEETGFIGAVVTIGLFMWLAARGLRAARLAPDLFGALMASGLTLWITLQAAMNILVVVAAIPTTGIPLPFISFGGTALVMNLFAVGVLLNISRQGVVAS